MPKSFDQAAAVPLRDGLIGLVTSSNGRRWVVPKGSIEPGNTPQETARIEAWEEAGWLGLLESEPIGSYSYEKLGRERSVLVYVLRVIEERKEWPEKALRTREWVPREEACERIEEAELRLLLRSLNI
jgi:8-oxo-dGTP pyrophosphatase MutT (NUDIX family)